MRTAISRTGLAASLAFAFVVLAGSFAILPAAHADDDMWSGIRKDTFGTRPIEDANGKIVLDAPIRAEDASTVPLGIHMPGAFAKDVKSLTLIIDQNPSPIVAVFKYGEAAGNGDRSLETRVRVDRYTDIRAIAETTDGKLYMTTKYVKASGGCSAPASKDAEEAAKSMGKMQIKTALKQNPANGPQEAQVMIKHPNNSGLQMNQLTRDYTPAHFVEKLEVRTDKKMVFSMEGGISISENPNFRFSYSGNPADVMTVHAEDNQGNVFDGHSGSNPS